jgi:phage portal protein BeeE
MKLFGLNFSVSRNAPSNRQSEIGNRNSFDPQAWLAGNDFPRSCTLSNPLEQSAWVYRAASVIADQIANIPFVFSRGERGRESMITRGPLVQFYNQPHPYLNRFQYWELRVLWLLLRGECFRVPIFEESSPSSSSNPGGASVPAIRSVSTPSDPKAFEKAFEHASSERKIEFLRQLQAAVKGGPIQSLPCVPRRPSVRVPSGKRLKAVVILNPDHFHEIIEDHQLIGWRYTGFSKFTPLHEQVFLPEEVWVDRLSNPFNFWRGLSPLHPANLAAASDHAAANYMRGIIENNAENGLIVRTDQQLTDEQRTQIVSSLRNRKRGAGVADQTILLWGATEIVQPKLTSADLQFLENRKFARGEICAALGVPEEIVATTDHNQYDVMQGARQNFIENRVIPLCARIEAEEQETVQAIDRDAVGWFDIDSLPIMQQARRDRLAAAKIGFEMGIPFNELNRVLDLGFKHLPHGDSPFLPGNLQQVGARAGRAAQLKTQTSLAE